MQQYFTPENFYNWLKNPDRETLVMGIVNVTPDSFSDGGKYFQLDSAFEHVLRLLRDGADIIDIGGESTRPGSIGIPLDQELKRTIPLIEKIRSFSSNILISIDTTKSEVARQALFSGANIINDISGLSNDMATVASNHQSPVIIMHMQGNPSNMQNSPYYNDLIGEISAFFKSQIKLAINKGIKRDYIILDPGIGFGKTVKDNFALINNLKEFCNIGFPILIGPSRKSFIGVTLDEPIEDRFEGTAASVVAGIMRGARIVRVHNVKGIKKVVKITEMIRTAK